MFREIIIINELTSPDRVRIIFENTSASSRDHESDEKKKKKKEKKRKEENAQLSRADVPSRRVVRFTAAKQRLMMT